MGYSINKIVARRPHNLLQQRIAWLKYIKKFHDMYAMEFLFISIDYNTAYYFNNGNGPKK